MIQNPENRFYVGVVSGQIIDRRTGTIFTTQEAILACMGRTLNDVCDFLNGLVPESFGHLRTALDKVDPSIIPQIEAATKKYWSEPDKSDTVFSFWLGANKCQL